MGKPTGFMEYPRELPLAQAPAERVHHWSEFHEHANEKRMLREQGALHGLRYSLLPHRGRCSDGMASGCPINNLSRR